MSTNIPLLLIDILFLPISLIRLIAIYFWGSKYGIRGFQFLDVIMHADSPYFNQEDCRMINTIGKDYRCVIRDDSRIFPMDINKYIQDKKQIIDSTEHRTTEMWDVATENCQQNNNNDSDEESNESKDLDESEDLNESEEIETEQNIGVTVFGDNSKTKKNKKNRNIIDSVMEELQSAFDNGN